MAQNALREKAEAIMSLNLQNAGIALEAKDLAVWYGSALVLKGINLPIPRKDNGDNRPSGCGKSTLLRCFNRMNDMIIGFQRRRAGAHR